jgi:hypothetical protein
VLRNYVQGFIEEIEEVIKRWSNVQQIFGVSEGDSHKEAFQVGIGVGVKIAKFAARWLDGDFP